MASLIFEHQVRPARPTNPQLRSLFGRAFRSKFEWSTGLVLPLAGSAVVVALAPNDLGWLGALATSAVAMSWTAWRASIEPVSTWLRWYQVSRLFDSEDARRTRLSAEVAARGICIAEVNKLVAAIKQEERSVIKYVSVPQYGDLRPPSIPLGMISSSMQLLGLHVSQVERDVAPALADEPPLEAFLVRGEGAFDGTSAYSQVHRDSQRLFKRQIYRQELSWLRAVNLTAVELRSLQAKKLDDAESALQAL
jgi:hypothetical protein